MNKKWDGAERRNTVQLRELAEAMLANIMPVQVQKQPAEELLHELQIKHIELEMQAEQLRSAQVALEESRDRYVSLYDFAPVGYLTLTGAGLIAEVNLTGAVLLGTERKKLLQCRFAKFVAPEAGIAGISTSLAHSNRARNKTVSWLLLARTARPSMRGWTACT